MYEHSINIDEAFRNGLMPNDQARKNSPWCLTLQNLRPTSRGLVQVHPVTLPETLTGSTNIAYDFPFPQWFQGQYVNILAKETSIHLEDNGYISFDWSPRAIAFTEHLTNGNFNNGTTFPTGWNATAFNEGHWTFTAGSITHVAGNTSAVIQTSANMQTPLIPNLFYRMAITVTGMTAGSLQVQYFLGGQAETQLTITENGTFALKDAENYIQGNATLRLIPSTGFDGTVQEITVTGHAPTTITTGDPWQFASFQESFFLTNAQTFCYKFPGNGRFAMKANSTYLPRVIGQDDTRLWFGNMKGDWFETARGQKVFQQWRRFAPKHIYRINDHFADGNRTPVRPNFVFFSDEVGQSNDMPHFLGLAAFGFLGNELFDQVEPLIMQAIEDGAVGMIPMAFTGDVMAIRQLGTRMLVYGKRGVSALWPVQGMWREQHYSKMGIHGRMAVNGHDQLQCYVDSNRGLWLVVNEQAPQYVDYTKYMPTGSNIVVSFDPQEIEWWITDGTTCVVMTQTGLGGPMDIKPTSLFRHPAYGLVGVAGNQNNETLPLKAISGEIDIAERGTKHITTLQLSADQLYNGQSRIHYRYDKNADMKVSPYKKYNRQNVVFPRLSFSDMRVEVEGIGYQDNPAHIEKVEVRYNNEDRRYRRGTKGIPEEA